MEDSRRASVPILRRTVAIHRPSRERVLVGPLVDDTGSVGRLSDIATRKVVDVGELVA